MYLSETACICARSYILLFIFHYNYISRAIFYHIPSMVCTMCVCACDFPILLAHSLRKRKKSKKFECKQYRQRQQYEKRKSIFYYNHVQIHKTIQLCNLLCAQTDAILILSGYTRRYSASTRSSIQSSACVRMYALLSITLTITINSA